MSNYKLTYFNITAYGEPIRFLLSYGKVPFEDKRLVRNGDEWPKLKPNMPLEQLPVLEVDGKTLYQSNSIIRYLAKKLNLFGSSDFEAFQVDVAIETMGELKQLLSRWYVTADAAVKAATKQETEDKTNFYLRKFEEIVKKNGGYFVDGKVTAADIVFASFHQFFAFLIGKDMIADYPSLKALVDKVVALPAIKAYIAQRPETEF